MHCAVEPVESHRMYGCARCGEQVHVCRRCDHGQIYCAGACAAIRRRESQRCAGARYQESHSGAIKHAARQNRLRARERDAKQKVTHQGSLGDGGASTVAAHPTAPPGTLAYASRATRQQSFVPRHTAAAPRCTFCGRALSPFIRLHALHRRL